VRWPAAQAFIRENRLNEAFDGTIQDLGIVCQGGMYNVAVRALQQLGLADVFGDSAISIYALNVTYPLVPEEVTAFCAGKRAVLVIEEGSPRTSRRAARDPTSRGPADQAARKGLPPDSGRYTGEVVLAAWRSGSRPSARRSAPM